MTMDENISEDIGRIAGSLAMIQEDTERIADSLDAIRHLLSKK